jgi:hypothetical protein
VVYFGGFFAKLGHFAGFSQHFINFPKWISEAATGGVHYIFRVPCSSFRVRCRSVVYSELRRMQRSSEGCSVAQKGPAYPEGAANFLGRGIAQVGCSFAQKGAA